MTCQQFNVVGISVKAFFFFKVVMLTCPLSLNLRQVFIGNQLLVYRFLDFAEEIKVTEGMYSIFY